MPQVSKEDRCKSPSFYEMPEGGIYRMLWSHYFARHTETGFSSWAASLHLVSSYATQLSSRNKKESQVTVMDTHDLDEEVLV